LKISWNELIAGLPQAHILQSHEWGQVKTQNGWQPNYLLWIKDPGSDPEEIDFIILSEPVIEDVSFSTENILAAALLLTRDAGLPVTLGIAYCPKGPLLNWSNTALRNRVLLNLKETARQRGAIFLKIDPDVKIGTGIPGTLTDEPNPVGEAVMAALSLDGWHPSGEQVQFRNTAVLDLRKSEDELIAGFKQKTRYNIRLSERKGVKIHSGTGADLDILYSLYAETAVRDSFTIRDADYYRRAWGDFFRVSPDGLNVQLPQKVSEPGAIPLIAEFEKQPIAALIVYQFSRRGWFLFGMSRAEHRDKMPNYLLQWEAIKALKHSGSTSYDLWGAPDEFMEGDPLWGVYRFKKGFQGEIHRHIGAWDFPIRPFWYRLYNGVLPWVLDLMRARGNRSTRQIAAR
jgi:peptidoglycan pentaglycine glycine transferase (the first glycine)